MDFVKMEGLGNDFIVVDGPIDISAETITAWCDRRFGVGADGVLEMTSVSPDRIRMRYWNRDGGEAEMCGNGLRCLALLASDRGWLAGPDLVVETAAGDLPATVRDDGLVRALVGRPHMTAEPFDFDGVRVHPVGVGNPHAVLFVSDAGAAPVGELGPRLERHVAFPHHTNVEFVEVVDSNSLAVRIWERGVGETKASGTGAAAAAYAAGLYRGVESPIAVTLPGGLLTIDLEADSAWMTGPGRVVFKGSVDQG